MTIVPTDPLMAALLDRSTCDGDRAAVLLSMASWHHVVSFEIALIGVMIFAVVAINVGVACCILNFEEEDDVEDDEEGGELRPGVAVVFAEIPMPRLDRRIADAVKR